MNAKKEFLAIDCFEPGCADKYSANFNARLASPSGTTFRIITESESGGELEKKENYLEKGSSYEFCGRELVPPEGITRTETLYQIDDPNSIQLIDEGDYGHAKRK